MTPAHRTGGPGIARAQPADDHGVPLDTARFAAFGTTAIVATADPARLVRARERVERTVEEFDRACSRFRDDSELSAVNAGAGTAVRCGPVLLDAVAEALRAAWLTRGDVDPTIGEVLLALGYDRDFDLISSASSHPAPGRPVDATVERRLQPIAKVPGWRTVLIDRSAGTVRIAPGVKLDLGATAKALAADRAVAAALTATCCGVLVGFGGDLAVAGAPPRGGWRVRVCDDHRDPEGPGQWITLSVGGLATSSTTARRWRSGQVEVHHLVDPATGRPAESVWRTVSVAAASCLDANIASTAAIVRGARAVPWLESLGLPSRLVGVDGRARHVAGWPAEGDDLR